MAVPFGFSVGDCLTVSKLIYKISKELKENSASPIDYQLLLIELEALDRTLKSLKKLTPAHHESGKLEAIRALALTCSLPLQEFLDRIEKYEESLGSWNAGKRTPAAVGHRLRWSLKYKGDAKALRARLAPNVATISMLLLTETAETLYSSGAQQSFVAHDFQNSVAKQTTLLSTLSRSADTMLSGQECIKSALNDRRDNILALDAKVDGIDHAISAQSARLEVQDAALAVIEAQAATIGATTFEIAELAKKTQDDTSTIRGMIPSLLACLLSIRSIVAGGVAHLQNIVQLLQQLLHLAKHFSAEVLDPMKRLMEAFFTIQAQLARFHQILPRHLCLPIIQFRDAFGIIRAFPYDLSRDFQTFERLLLVAFAGKQGLKRVERAQYFITHARTGRKIGRQFWSNAIHPGDELTMTMIIEELATEEGFCPFESCRASTHDIAVKSGGKVCPACFRFAAVEKSSRGARWRNAYNGTREHTIPTQSQLREVEDIELYSSIQVAKLHPARIVIDQFLSSYDGIDKLLILGQLRSGLEETNLYESEQDSGYSAHILDEDLNAPVGDENAAREMAASLKDVSGIGGWVKQQRQRSIFRVAAEQHNSVGLVRAPQSAT